MKKDIALLLILILILSGCSQSVESIDSNDTEIQIKELEEKISSLESSLNTLQSENQALKQEINEPLGENEQLKGELLETEEYNSTSESSESSVKDEKTTNSAEDIEAIRNIFKEANLDAYDFMENLFFMEAYQHSTMDFRNFDYTQEMMDRKDALLVYEERSKDMGIYEDLMDYGVGLIMDAIFPYSSILMIFSEEEEKERKSDDLMMEVNFNIEQGRNAGLKQVDIMDKIEAYYTLQNKNKLSDDDVVDFMNSFIEYYENELSRLSTIHINEEKVELMTTLFMIKTDNTFEWNEEEEIAKTDEELSRIAASLKKLDDLYNKLKKYQ